MADTSSRDLWPLALVAANIPPRATPSNYPEPLASLMAGREKRALGDAFGLSSFGVNLTRLAPGAQSALLHAHDVQDEFVYVLSGIATLVMDDGEAELRAGMCDGFRAGGAAHQLINRGVEDVVYLEIGDRLPSDSVTYPQDDLVAARVEGQWVMTHKDGSPY